MSKSATTNLGIKSFQSKSYLVPKIKARATEEDCEKRDAQPAHAPVPQDAGADATVQVILPAPAVEAHSDMPDKQPGMKKAATKKKAAAPRPPTHAGCDGEELPCEAMAKGRPTRSRSASAEPGPQEEPPAALAAQRPACEAPADKGRPPPAGKPAVAAAGAIDEFANGDEIFRYMKQLGSSVDDAFGEDEKLAGGGRRASKEKKCTPLKEKLHKMWGGRGYMERLDVVMAQEAGQQGTTGCEDQPAEEVFKPMFLSHPAASVEPAEADGQDDEVVIQPPQAHPQPKASPSRRHPPPATSSARAATEGAATKSSKQQQRAPSAATSSGKATKALGPPAAAVTTAPVVASIRAEVVSEKPAINPPSKAKAVGVQARPAAGLAATTPALPSSSSRLPGKGGTSAAAGASPMDIDGEGPASTAERTVKAPSSLLPGGAGMRERKRAGEGGLPVGKRAAVGLPVAVAAALPCPAPRSSSLAGRPSKKAPGTAESAGRVGGSETPASSLLGLGAAQTSPSPQAAKRPREAVGAVGGSGSAAQCSGEESRAKVARLQLQCDGRAAEIAVLKGEKKELEGQLASLTRLREVQDEELAKAKSRSSRLEQEVKELKQQAADQKLKEKTIKEVASKLDKCKKMVEAASVQLSSLVDDA